MNRHTNRWANVKEGILNSSKCCYPLTYSHLLFNDSLNSYNDYDDDDDDDCRTYDNDYDDDNDDDCRTYDDDYDDDDDDDDNDDDYGDDGGGSYFCGGTLLFSSETLPADPSFSDLVRIIILWFSRNYHSLI